MGDIQRADEQPTESVVKSDQENVEPGHLDNSSQEPTVNFQHVIITLADGRRGVFMGPELIKEIEMTLNTVPKLVSVDFDPPRAVAIPIKREEVANDIKAEDNQNIPAAPEAGLEQNA